MGSLNTKGLDKAMAPKRILKSHAEFYKKPTWSGVINNVISAGGMQQQHEIRESWSKVKEEQRAEDNARKTAEAEVTQKAETKRIKEEPYKKRRARIRKALGLADDTILQTEGYEGD